MEEVAVEEPDIEEVSEVTEEEITPADDLSDDELEAELEELFEENSEDEN